MCLFATHVQVPMEARKCRVFGVGLQVAVISPAWMLGLDLRSSVRAARALIAWGPIIYCFFFFLFSSDRISCSSGWLGASYVKQASPELVRDPLPLPLSASLISCACSQCTPVSAVCVLPFLFVAFFCFCFSFCLQLSNLALSALLNMYIFIKLSMLNTNSHVVFSSYSNCGSSFLCVCLVCFPVEILKGGT